MLASRFRNPRAVPLPQTPLGPRVSFPERDRLAVGWLPNWGSGRLGQLYTVRTIGEIVYVDLTTEFVICLDHLMPLWRSVVSFCRAKHYIRVLIEGHAPHRRMGPIDVYEHGVQLRGRCSHPASTLRRHHHTAAQSDIFSPGKQPTLR